VHDETLYVFRRLYFPYFLETNAVTLRISIFSQIELVDEFLTEVS
jgi:hypothetical protein